MIKWLVESLELRVLSNYDGCGGQPYSPLSTLNFKTDSQLSTLNSQITILSFYDYHFMTKSVSLRQNNQK